MSLSLDKKIERALNALPYEIIVQYSSATDSVAVLAENAKQESEEEGISFLQVLLNYTNETIETYECELLSHINYHMQFGDLEEQRMYREERKELYKFKKKLEKYLLSEEK